MINIRDIHAFLELVEQCNFNAAAESLHLTQSGLSRKIARIEAQVTQRLFDRTTRFVKPTPACLLLARHWGEALQGYQAGIHAIRGSDNELAGSLAVGVSATSRHGVWQGLGERFAQRYPKVSIRIEAIPSQDVIHHVKNGDLEAGFCGGPVDDISLGVIRIETVRYQALVPAAHRFARRKVLKLADLQAEPLVLVNRRTWPRVRAPIDAILAPLGLLDRVVVEPHFSEVLLRHVVQDGLVGVHPVGACQLLPSGMKAMEIRDLTLSLDNSFIWRRSTTSPIVRTLLNVVEGMDRPMAAESTRALQAGSWRAS